MKSSFTSIYPVVSPIDILFRQITTFINVCVAFVFGLLTLSLVDFTKIFQFKGFKPKNKGQTNFYECCDLTKKSISNDKYIVTYPNTFLYLGILDRDTLY